MAGHHEGPMQTMMYSGQMAPSGEHMIEYTEEGQMYRGPEAESGRPTSDSRAGQVDNDKTPILSERRSVNDAQGTLEVHHRGSGHASDQQTLLSPFQTAKVDDAHDKNSGYRKATEARNNRLMIRRSRPHRCRKHQQNTTSRRHLSMLSIMSLRNTYIGVIRIRNTSPIYHSTTQRSICLILEP
jgi:hypothetical protein